MRERCVLPVRVVRARLLHHPRLALLHRVQRDREAPGLEEEARRLGMPPQQLRNVGDKRGGRLHHLHHVPKRTKQRCAPCKQVAAYVKQGDLFRGDLRPVRLPQRAKQQQAVVAGRIGADPCELHRAGAQGLGQQRLESVVNSQAVLQKVSTKQRVDQPLGELQVLAEGPVRASVTGRVVLDHTAVLQLHQQAKGAGGRVPHVGEQLHPECRVRRHRRATNRRQPGHVHDVLAVRRVKVSAHLFQHTALVHPVQAPHRVPGRAGRCRRSASGAVRRGGGAHGRHQHYHVLGIQLARIALQRRKVRRHVRW